MKVINNPVITNLKKGFVIFSLIKNIFHFHLIFTFTFGVDHVYIIV